jgi:hypothetical protein
MARWGRAREGGWPFEASVGRSMLRPYIQSIQSVPLSGFPTRPHAQTRLYTMQSQTPMGPGGEGLGGATFETPSKRQSSFVTGLSCVRFG